MSSIGVMLVIEATAGGTARYIETIVPALVEQNIRVHVACCARRDPDFLEVIERFREANIPVTEISMARGISPIADMISLWRLRALVRRCRPDIVHLHSSKAGGLGRLAAACGMPGVVLYTPHAFAFLDRSHRIRSFIILILEKLLARWTGVLVAVSESEARAAVAHKLASADGTCVVPNAIDAKSRTHHLSGSQRRTGDRAIVGHLGRMEEQKDPLRLVELAWELEKRGVAAELQLAGSGPLLEPCQMRAWDMGLEDRLRFLGYVRDVAAFYTALDIFVLTSRYEGLPYTVLDAMYYGLPVVAFDVPGVRDLVACGVTGLLVPPGNVSRLADSIVRLVESPTLAKRMGARGADRVAKEFRLEQQVNGLTELYRRCVAARR